MSFRVDEGFGQEIDACNKGRNGSARPGVMCIVVAIARYQFNLAKVLQLCIHVYFGKRMHSRFFRAGDYL